MLLLAGAIAFRATSIEAGSAWLTFSGDLQRTGLATSEHLISAANADDLGLLWKTKLNTEPKQMTGPTTPVVATDVNVSGTLRDLVLVGGASDDLFVVDARTGEQIWARHLETKGTPRQLPSWTCPSALNATPIVDRRTKIAHAISSNGTLYSIDIRDGEDRRIPTAFVPPYSKNWTLALVDGVVYTTISQDCNGVRSGVYALDVQNSGTSPVSFQAATSGAGIWGRAGAAVDSEGLLII